MASLTDNSPLDERSFQGNSLHICECKDFSFVQLKGHRITGNALSEIGMDAEPLTIEDKIVWIGPNERLLLDERGSDVLLAHLDILPPQAFFTRNASSGLIAIEITGDSTQRLLQAETRSIDFTLGFAARLRIADLPVVVIVRAPDRVLCLVQRSVARWLFDWLANRADALHL